MEEVMHYEKCGEERVIMDAITRMLVCESCGFVNEEAIYTAVWDLTIGDGMGNFVSTTDTEVCATSRWVNNNRAYDYHQGKEVIAMNKLEDITSLLRLPVERVCEVKYMVEKLSQGRWGAGRWTPSPSGFTLKIVIVVAILAFIAEVDEVNVGLEDISKELNVPIHTYKIQYKELQESLVRVG
ncbi:hypothetical protein KI387_008749 [Taxus chinensis]|uniref:Uncharacterized protein n=1 Tax=Taxus chinensis TaxID=29808 RepID=A0AA38FIX3_TAXCH|nr:hypothetical protein KI387_008749 [Taxus chinensis]